MNSIAGITPQASFPFKITTRINPSNPSLYQAMVSSDSVLMLSAKPNDNLAITGLGIWFSLIATDVICLSITIADYVATVASIKSYGMGNTAFDPSLSAWDSSNNGFVWDDGMSPPKQIGANILLGYSNPVAGKPYFVQAQFNHILLENCAIDTLPAIFDFSHRNRFGILAP